jgi:hypothetical protein
MRMLSIFYRCLLQEVRDPLTLVLTIFTTPFFMFFYWFLMTDSTISIGVLNPDSSSITEERNISTNFISELEKSNRKESDINKSTAWNISQFETKESLETNINSGQVDIEIQFVKSNDTFTTNSQNLAFEIKIISHLKSKQARQITTEIKSKIDSIILNELKSPISSIIIFKGPRSVSSPFDEFVPSFLVFSIIMILFSTAMMLTTEIESGLLIRYALSDTPIHQYLIGSSLIQFLNASVSICLSLLLTRALGFHFEGKELLVFLLCLCGALGSIGLGMMIASFMKTTNQAFLASSFFMFLLLLFSGIIFPKPNISFAWIDQTRVEIFGLLPTAILKSSLDGVLFEHKELWDIRNELLISLGSSILYIYIGVHFFRKILRLSGKNK